MPSSKSITPYWKSDCGRAVIYQGDCLDVMSRLQKEQFHAIVTDPPYGLEFMGKEWDAPWKSDAHIKTAQCDTDESHPFRNGSNKVCFGSDSKRFQEWFEKRASVMLDITKPGAHILSFGGTRMFHRMFCAIEDAGWEVRDTIMWVYGTGFPKGKDIGKGIDEHMGASRTETNIRKQSSVMGANMHKNVIGKAGYGFSDTWGESEAVTDEAKQWDGWNSTLKPALEPICVAQKPYSGTLAECVLKNGCGGINVDGCQIGEGELRQTSTGGMANKASPVYGEYSFGGKGYNKPSEDFYENKETTEGRWPANFIHDGSIEVVSLLPNGAARFFYSPKADASDRPHGKGKGHPTVKPLDLMRYLVRLVCAKGGIVLDPFMGSGSTGCAAVLEGMNFVGIEKDTEHGYIDMAVGRLKLALEGAPPLEELKTYSGKKQSVSTRTGTPPPIKRIGGAGKKGGKS